MFSKKEKKPKECNLSVLHYDGERYKLITNRIPVTDLPYDAVHITGEKDNYFLDSVGLERDPPALGSMNAVDLNLYMINNDINDALAIGWKGNSSVDLKKWIMIGVIGLIGACCLFAFWPTV